MHRLVKILSESRIVDSIISVDSDAYGEFHKIKIQARLINGWKLHVWEHVTPSIRRYAFDDFSDACWEWKIAME